MRIELLAYLCYLATEDDDLAAAFGLLGVDFDYERFPNNARSATEEASYRCWRSQLISQGSPEPGRA